MSNFSFKAKDEAGRILHGLVEARNEQEAVVLLHQRRLLVINLKAKGVDPLTVLTQRLRRVTFGDQVNFTRQLSTMFTAGLRLSESLRILEKQSENTAMQSIIAQMRRDIEAGSSFAAVLEKHDCFSHVYVAVVRAGEASGKLDQILSQLADNLEKQQTLRARIKGAMLYPAVILLAMGGVTFILMTFVVPGLTSVYEAFEADLPLATKILIAFSKFMSKFWWLLILAMAGAALALQSWLKTAFGKKTFDLLMLKAPLFGKLQRESVLTEFCRTLGLLASAGVPLIDGLNIVSEASSNTIYRDSIKEASKKVEKGFPLSTALEENPLFPAIVIQMARVGEETGKIDETLLRVATYFEVEVDQLVKGLTTLIEPLMMIVLGVGVGFMVYSIIMPIYKLVGNF